MKKLKVKFIKIYYALEREPRKQRKKQKRIKSALKNDIIILRISH